MVGHDILIEGVPDRRQAIEQILLIEYLTRLDATAGLARARRVDFRHQPMSAPSVYRANFGSEVRFGQAADAIVYGEQVLASPIVASDPSECRRVIARINGAFAEHEPPLHARVRGLVMHLLSSERCTDPDVAKELGLQNIKQTVGGITACLDEYSYIYAYCLCFIIPLFVHSFMQDATRS